ncbi:MAG: YqcC family protein [Deltaproteobacteria bacterium]|nr:YqcC family protein [Deltaproteobacteria bacterium]
MSQQPQSYRDQSLAGPALALADAIEAELKRLGWWSSAPLPAEALENPGAFGQRTMSAGQWLQHILLDRVRTAAAGGSGFPLGSNVAVWAVREFDGCDETGDLQRILAQFDRLFEPDWWAAAAGWHPERAASLSDPNHSDGPELFALPTANTAEVDMQIKELSVLLANGANVNRGHPQSGRTALHVAIAFGCDRAEQWLLEQGADPQVTDQAGRNAADWRILRLIGRLRGILPTVAGVQSARIAQLYFPVERTFTTPVVALELSGPIDSGALQALPPTDPAIFMVLGDDAVSRLSQLGAPFWRRPAEP